VSPGSGWYASGSQVSLAASAGSGYQFASFTTSINGGVPANTAANPQNLTLSTPIQTTATFNPVTPTPDSLSPNNLSSTAGQSVTFTAKFDDPSGAGDLQNAQVYFAAGGWPGQTPNCNVGYYNFGSNLYGLYLVDETNNSLGKPILSDGSNGVSSLANDACTVTVFAPPPANLSGTTLTFGFTAAFTSAFVGQRNDWGYATTFAQVHDDWHQFGAWSVTSPGAPDLTIYKAHTGAFTPGQIGAQYFLTVANAGGSPTSGAITVTDSVPSSMTATNIAGTGWNCTQPAGPCTRSDVLAAGASFPAIVLTVNVSSTAPSLVTNKATVSGGGETNTANDTAGDQTIISPSGTPDLTISKTHAGMFLQGQTGETYTITVTNVGNGFTIGPNPVTVQESLPVGLTPVSIFGSNWNCTQPLGPCSRPDILVAGGSFDPIIVTVNVNSDAPANVTNTVTVSGGGEVNTANDTADDPTAIIPYAPPTNGPPSPSVGLTIFPPSSQPSNFNSSLYGTFGVKFRSDVAGVINGVRLYAFWPRQFGMRGGSPSGELCLLYDGSGNLLGSATSNAPSSYGTAGWFEAVFSSPIPIAANTTYIAAYFISTGAYGAFADGGGLSAGYNNPPSPLHALAEGSDGPNGVFATSTSPQFPTMDSGGTNYWADVDFSPLPAELQPEATSGTGVVDNYTPGQAQQYTFNIKAATGQLIFRAFKST
jgi:uncharacterized repeat protein (TIGR01451 family)